MSFNSTHPRASSVPEPCGQYIWSGGFLLIFSDFCGCTYHCYMSLDLGRLLHGADITNFLSKLSGFARCPLLTLNVYI